MYNESEHWLSDSDDNPTFKFGFEIGLIILLAIGFFSLRQISEYIKFTDRISHLEEIQTHLQLAELYLRESEDAQKGFILSSQEAYVTDYNRAVKGFESQVLKVKQYVRVEEDLLNSLNELIKAANVKFEFMNKVMAAKAEGRSKAAVDMEIQGDGLAMMKGCQEYIKKLTTSLAEDIFRQKSMLKRAGEASVWLIFLGTALAFVFLLISRMLYRNEKSRLERLTGFLTEQKKFLIEAQSKAEESSRVKSEFLTNMSHEVRTPLNAISGLTQLLEKTSLSEQQKDYLDGVRGSAKSLLELINGILDFSKSETQSLALHLSPVNLPELLEEVKDIFAGQVKLKKIDLYVELAPDIKTVSADPLRLKQILLNLTSNAIKFTDKGSVKIKAFVTSRFDNKLAVKFEVCDSGVGIPEEAKAKIFQNFYQAHSSMHRKYGGTGLGLALCKNLVHKMNGRIGFNSTFGQGSVFWFEVLFDVAAPQLAKPEAIQEVMPSKDLSLLKILIVEDNLLNQKVLLGFLNQWSCTAEVASLGEEAFELVKQRRFDIIFLDCQLPDMDGFDVIKGLREIEKEKSYPAEHVVATTAHAFEGYREKCLMAGMDSYLTKPIELDLLYKILMNEKVQGTGFPTNAKKTVPKSMPSTAAEKTDSTVIHLDKSRWENLRKIPSSTGNFLKDIIDIFHQTFPQKLEELKKAHQEKNYQVLQDISHYLKSSCSNIGAKSMYQILNQIEELAEAQTLGEIGPLLRELENIYQKIAPEIKAA